MSEEPTDPGPLELTVQLVEAFARGDVDTIEGFGAEDVVLQTMALGLRFEGPEAIRSFIEDWLGSFADLAFELLEVRHLAHGVVFALLRQSGSPLGVVGSMGQEEAWVIVWHHGQIKQLASYLDVEEARGAAERLARERAEMGGEEPVTRDPIAVVRDAYDAWNRRDLHSWMSLLAEDVVYRPVASFTDSIERRGREQVGRFTEEFYEAWGEDFISTPDTIRLYGDAVVVRSLFSGHARASGVEISARMFSTIHVRDGQVIRWADFTDRADALRAAGVEG